MPTKTTRKPASKAKRSSAVRVSRTATIKAESDLLLKLIVVWLVLIAVFLLLIIFKRY